jgi:hypothetical protein
MKHPPRKGKTACLKRTALQCVKRIGTTLRKTRNSLCYGRQGRASHKAAA